MVTWMRYPDILALLAALRARVMGWMVDCTQGSPRWLGQPWA